MQLDAKSDSALISFNQPITIGARAGYLVLPSTMVYGLAGYSLGKGDDKGFIAGGGIEHFVTKNMSMALEYHNEFASAKTNVHGVMLLTNWRF